MFYDKATKIHATQIKVNDLLMYGNRLCIVIDTCSRGVSIVYLRNFVHDYINTAEPRFYCLAGRVAKSSDIFCDEIKQRG